MSNFNMKAITDQFQGARMNHGARPDVRDLGN